MSSERRLSLHGEAMIQPKLREGARELVDE